MDCLLVIQHNVQALHIACERGFASCVKVLIEECHADPSCKNEVFLIMLCCLCVSIRMYVHIIHVP